MLFFSQDDAVTIANMVPTMDRINAMLSSSATTPLAPAVKHALTFARWLMDKYYSKTDLSNVYHIAMGMYSSILITWILSQLTRQSFAQCSILNSSSSIFSSMDGRRTGSKLLRGLSGMSSASTWESHHWVPLPQLYIFPNQISSLSMLLIYILSSSRKMLSLKTSLTSPWMVSRR